MPGSQSFCSHRPLPTVRDRRKTVNLERDPRPTIAVYRANDPYRYVDDH